MNVFALLERLDFFLWAYCGVGLIVLMGLFLTIKSRLFQVLQFGKVFHFFVQTLKEKESDSGGVHPIKVFFAGIGGAIGVGNVVGIVTAIQIGGPGALFWTWIAAFFGMILKYSEVFLGVKYRENNPQGGYNGGPMYFLRKAFSFKGIATIVSLLLCIYGVEIYVFGVIVDSIELNWGLNKVAIVATLLALVLLGGSGGIKRVGTICTWIIPIFLLIYLGMSCWVIFKHVHLIPSILVSIFHSAFNGHAAVGGFVGSSFLLAASQGVARGCYSGDLGIGYASIVHSETRETRPERQASLALFGIFLDTIVVCSLSILLILLTGVWSESISSSMLVQVALAKSFPFMSFFMPLFLFLLGYSTLITYLAVGLKCAHFIAPKWGRKAYFTYAVGAFVFFSFFNANQALLIMSISGGLLMIINLLGIFKLHKELHFDLDLTVVPKTTSLS